MTVLEYVARFTELACFADDYVAMDMAKVMRFENGLKLFIRGRIVGLRLHDMDSMVGTTLTIEREIENARSTQDAGVSTKRKESQSSSGSGKKQKASSSRGFQGCGHPGQGQIRVSSQAGQTLCYHCQQPRHMRRDCPQRQGSQGFETVQSQSTMGQERIQYIPSQPSTCQRSQYQFQGAAQAPSVTQAGQRGQVMGRGRGRGPQAGMSEVQGRVYAITPPVE